MKRLNLADFQAKKALLDDAVAPLLEQILGNCHDQQSVGVGRDKETR